jgi:hypothetical protein
VRAAQRRATAEHDAQMQRFPLDGGDRRERPDDVEILLDHARARQPEMLLNGT